VPFCAHGDVSADAWSRQEVQKLMLKGTQRSTEQEEASNTEPHHQSQSSILKLEESRSHESASRIKDCFCHTPPPNNCSYCFKLCYQLQAIWLRCVTSQAELPMQLQRRSLKYRRSNRQISTRSAHALPSVIQTNLSVEPSTSAVPYTTPSVVCGGGNLGTPSAQQRQLSQQA
jgi:hypothetical protein